VTAQRRLTGGLRAGEARLSVRVHPSGEFRARLVRPGQSSAAVGGALVYCGKVQEKPKRRSDDRPGFGALPRWTAFGSSSRRKVRDCVTILDSMGSENALFLTGTLPAVSVEAFECISKWSSWVVQTLMQWIRDYAPDSRVVWVWEFQKRGALHWHAAVVCVDARSKRRIKRGFRTKWIRTLKGVEDRGCVPMFLGANGVDHWQNKRAVRAEAACVRKSLANYLAKYLSKGTTCGAQDVLFPPARWWSADRATTREAKAACKTFVSGCMELGPAVALRDAVFRKIETIVAKVIRYANPVDSLLDGVCGFFTQSRLADAKSMVVKWLQGGRDAPVLRAVEAPCSDNPLQALTFMFGAGTKLIGQW